VNSRPTIIAKEKWEAAVAKSGHQREKLREKGGNFLCNEWENLSRISSNTCLDQLSKEFQATHYIVMFFFFWSNEKLLVSWKMKMYHIACWKAFKRVQCKLLVPRATCSHVCGKKTQIMRCHKLKIGSTALLKQDRWENETTTKIWRNSTKLVWIQFSEDDLQNKN
jgi:hypothetical protein